MEPEPRNPKPKVTANKPALLSTGEWLLPFWRERAMLSTKGPECASQRGRESAGVLVSRDRGATWTSREVLTTKGTWLIENAVVEGAKPGSAYMVFRTQTGSLFASSSAGGGTGWSRPAAVPGVPNPNSKVDLIRLHPTGDLLLAFNDHKRPLLLRPRDPLVPMDPHALARLPVTGECRKCRSHLRLAISRDGGQSFKRVASIEEEVTITLNPQP